MKNREPSIGEKIVRSGTAFALAMGLSACGDTQPTNAENAESPASVSVDKDQSIQSDNKPTTETQPDPETASEVYEHESNIEWDNKLNEPLEGTVNSFEEQTLLEALTTGWDSYDESRKLELVRLLANIMNGGETGRLSEINIIDYGGLNSLSDEEIVYDTVSVSLDAISATDAIKWEAEKGNISIDPLTAQLIRAHVLDVTAAEGFYKAYKYDPLRPRGENGEELGPENFTIDRTMLSSTPDKSMITLLNDGSSTMGGSIVRVSCKIGPEVRELDFTVSTTFSSVATISKMVFANS